MRGKLVHNVLENFFHIKTDNIDKDNYVEHLTQHLKDLFHAVWDKEKNSIRKHCKSDYDVVHYYEETLQMMANWLNHLFLRLHTKMKDKSFADAFAAIKPAMIEEEFRSEGLKVRGFIDYIEHSEDGVKIMDYKTSKHAQMTPEYRLQLAIYALLYSERFGKHPNKVGLWFLKHGEVSMDVTHELILEAKFEIEQIHVNTQEEDIVHYPKKVTPLCKYSTGECDFYRVCFGHEPMPLVQINKAILEAEKPQAPIINMPTAQPLPSLATAQRTLS